jgi:hypothetical protein
MLWAGFSDVARMLLGLFRPVSRLPLNFKCFAHFQMRLVSIRSYIRASI